VLTDEGNYLNFLSILVLIASSYPVAVAASIRNTANSGEHESRRHDERGDYGSRCPYPTTRYDGHDET
jgi:hypothetical protein